MKTMRLLLNFVKDLNSTRIFPGSSVPHLNVDENFNGNGIAFINNYSHKYIRDTSSWSRTFSWQLQTTFDSHWNKTRLYVATLCYSRWCGQSLLSKGFSRKKTPCFLTFKFSFPKFRSSTSGCLGHWQITNVSMFRTRQKKREIFWKTRMSAFQRQVKN